MSTLKETKSRIASVKSTLKITSAMKLVSSAKLAKAQKAISAMRPYERELQEILSMLRRAVPAEAPSVQERDDDWVEASAAPAPVAIVAIASNSSLCGPFNNNAIAKVREVRRSGDTVYAVGDKMADAMRRDGFPSPEDFSALAETPSFTPAASLAEQLIDAYNAGRWSKVLLVYNHFVSTGKQVPVVEQLLPYTPAESLPDDAAAAFPDDVIVEPSAAELLSMLVPKALKLQLYVALMDSAAAEHAARTVAMQTATDNGGELLDELTLQYNKARQQKITNEILDLAGGQAE